MTNSTAAGEKPATPTAKRRRRSRTSQITRRRRAEAASQQRAVVASFVFEEVVAPSNPPDPRLFVRQDVLSSSEVRAMFDGCSPTSRIGLRDRALIAVAYWACARPSEARRLVLDDVDPSAGSLTVRGRTGTRVVQLPIEAAGALANWAEKRRRLHEPREHVGLFCTLAAGKRPGPMTVESMEAALRRAARSAEIVAKPVGFSHLRAARAKELALAGVELAALADLLDQTRVRDGARVQDLSETRRFVTTLAPEAPCIAFYRRHQSPICRSDYRSGRAPANKGKRYPSEALTPEELRAMLRQLPKTSSAGMRNRALIIVMWRCGLRVAEALALEVRDLDLKEGTVTVRHGKGDKRRIVGMDPQAAREFDRWLAARERLGLGRSGLVFCKLNLPYRGGKVNSSQVRELLKDLAHKAGIQKRVHPHGLRHTHAFELAKEGIPLPIIQKQLGHNDLITTARYLDHFAPVHVITAMQAREWSFTR